MLCMLEINNNIPFFFLINETRERVKATVKSLWCCMLGGRKKTAEFLTGRTEPQVLNYKTQLQCLKLFIV